MGTLYLQVQAGPLLVLLEASGVHEVLDGVGGNEGSGAASARGHVQWRDEVLPAIELGRFFGFDGARPGASVVYGAAPEQPPLVFQVDRVLGLHKIELHEWKRLPALPADVTRFFDAAYAGAGQELLSYRLRSELDPASFGVLAEEQIAD